VDTAFGVDDRLLAESGSKRDGDATTPLSSWVRWERLRPSAQKAMVCLDSGSHASPGFVIAARVERSLVNMQTPLIAAGVASSILGEKVCFRPTRRERRGSPDKFVDGEGHSSASMS
jgi:hypothetical protein